MDLADAWDKLAQERGVKIVELANEIATLRTKLAMRDQQLREADAVVARLRVDVDDLRLVAVRADMQRMALAERLGSAEPETAPEPWEAIVTAALRWRDGADRGDLARAVDAFRGHPQLEASERWHCDACGFESPKSVDSHTSGMVGCHCRHEMRRVCAWKEPSGAMLSDLKGLAARESDPLLHTLSSAPVVKGPLHREDEEAVAEFSRMKRVPLRPEQYADGAGAQAWRQAMGGKVCACAGELIGREQIHGVVKCSSGFESS